MSTDVLPMSVLLFRARRDLGDARSRQQQAEDAQRAAEEVARRAEERATRADDEADGWRMFAVDLVGEYIVDTRIPAAAPHLVESIADSLHHEWSISRPAIKELSISEIVFAVNGDTKHRAEER